MTVPREYEVFALRYAVNEAQRASHNFIGGDPHDAPMPLDYFVWLIRGGERCFIVDTGFDAAMARKRSRTHLACPGDILAALGVSAGDVREVIVTHLHYDHCGNHELFPSATYHLQDREMAYATGRCMCHPSLRQPFEYEDVAAMVAKVFEGRVTFHDGAHVIAPGLELHRVGGHTDGLQVVRVWTRRGWLVLASDASHFYANMEQSRPFPLVYNVGDMLEGYRTCYALASHPANVIPGHDPLVTRRYPAAAPSLDDRIVRLDADPV